MSMKPFCSQPRISVIICTHNPRTDYLLRTDTGFGIFPELRVTHLISAARVQREYFLRLVRAHRFSHAVLRYLLHGTKPRPAMAFPRFRLIVHGLKNGWFSMRCRQASMVGQSDATQFIRNNHLKSLPRALNEKEISLTERPFTKAHVVRRPLY